MEKKIGHWLLFLFAAKVIFLNGTFAEGIALLTIAASFVSLELIHKHFNSKQAKHNDALEERLLSIEKQMDDVKTTLMGVKMSQGFKNVK